MTAVILAGAADCASGWDAPSERRGATPGPIRLTVEVAWGEPGDGPSGPSAQASGSLVTLEISEGRVIEAIPWPAVEPSGRRNGWAAGEAGTWRLGDAPRGRVRARIEARPESTILLRQGAQVVNVPVVAVLERPQRTPASAPISVSVERLAWDSLDVDLGAPADTGIVTTGSEVPVTIGLNILWPEPAEVAVRYSATFRPARGGDEISRRVGQEVVTANASETTHRILALPAPRDEGAYVLEVQASWEPVVHEGSRLGRLIRRRRASVTTTAIRRVSVIAMAPSPRPAPAPADSAAGRDRRRGEVVVDSVDLSRSRVHRPFAAGRSPMSEADRSIWPLPAEALIEPAGRDGLRGWFQRPETEVSRLESSSARGLAWSAVGLKVAHPDRPHRLTIRVNQGEPSALGVALIEPGGTRPRVLLDTCASGPPVLEDGPPITFSWPVWPGATEAVLVLVNRGADSAVRLGSITMTELDPSPVPAPIRPSDPSSARSMGLYLGGPRPLDRFGGDDSPAETWIAANHLAAYLASCGADAVIVPESIADRREPRPLDGRAEEDSTRPDRLEILRRVLFHHGIALWLEVVFDGSEALPGLPPPDSEEAVRRGLVRLDGRGHPDGSCYHPLHPEVRAAMRRRVTEALARGRSSEATPAGRIAGLIIRLGPGPTLLGTPETGIDDATYERFVHETFSPETAREVPGLGAESADRFTARLEYLAGAGRMPWLTWRTRAIIELYADLDAAAREARPDAVLAVVTPGLDAGPAALEARRGDLAGLTASHAWRSVGLDLSTWPIATGGPAVFRGVSLSDDPLAHDLATSSDLDTIVASRPRRGLLLGVAPPVRAADESAAIRLTAPSTADLSAIDEIPGHAMAALDPRWIFLAASAVAGQEERLHRFASAFRTLPAGPPSAASGGPDEVRTLPFGTVVRTRSVGDQTFLSLANDSPYPLRVACLIESTGQSEVEDLGRGFRLAPVAVPGGRNLVLDLIPFGLSAIRIAAPHGRLASLTEYPSEAVLAGMKAQSNELSERLARLNQGGAEGPTEPSNPGFEPAASPAPVASDPSVTTAGGTGPGRRTPPPSPRGWRLEPVPGSDASAPDLTIDTENPRAGRGSLRLSAPSTPASVVSDLFVPGMQSSLTIRAFFRAMPADARVRVWIEGESAGQSYVRRSELTIPGAWESQAVRASDLPPGGLDSARLRFELMTPGVLWLDDLRVGGDGSGKSIRLNAQRTMLAALQAYRERRYADFARLAGSHWVKQSAVLEARLARAVDWPKPRPGGTTEASASALPPDRKLR